MSRLELSRQQVRQVDQRAIHDCGMSGLVLMENAGRGCVDQLCELGVTGPVVICCGRGNNAGDGFVIARHLEIRGFSAKILLWSRPEDLAGDAAENFRIAVDQAVSRISSGSESLPKLGPVYRYAQVRRFPYVLIFRERSPESIMVMAVAHTSRRPGYWRGRR